MWTVGQRLRAEGRQEGRAEGRRKGLAEGRAKGRREGKAQGLAEGVLRILAARGVRVDARSRQRILGCTDLATLELWLERALRAYRLSEVLAQKSSTGSG